MKKIYSLLILLLSVQFASSQTDFTVQYRDGANYIIYQVSNTDTWSSLSTDFNVDIESLTLFNSIDNNNASISKSSIDVPLTESNFYKSSHIHQQKGFQAVYYPIHRSESVEDIARLYYIPKSTLLLWNKAEKFANGEKVIIGWLKYNKHLGSNENLVKESKVKTNNDNPSYATKSQVSPKTTSNTVYTKPKPTNSNTNSYSIAKPKPIKNDPNRSKDNTYRKPFKETWNNWISKLSPKKKETNSKATTTNKQSKSNQKSNTAYSNKKSSQGSKDKSFKNFWNKLVNGNSKSGTSNSNSYGKKKTNSNTKTAGAKLKENWNKLVKSKPKRETKTASQSYTAEAKTNKSNNKTAGTKIKDGWNKLVNGSDKTKKTAPAKSQKSTTPKPTAYQKPKPIIKEKTITTNTTSSIEEKKNKDSYTPTTDSLGYEMTIPEPKSEVVEPVPAAKTIVLTNNKNGKASFFYSGPIGAKFYVVSNLAPKGSIVKITNVSNGKYIMAEVIGSLSSADSSKGVIAKVSDNAKMPLGSNSTNLNIKLSY